MVLLSVQIGSKEIPTNYIVIYLTHFTHTIIFLTLGATTLMTPKTVPETLSSEF